MDTLSPAREVRLGRHTDQARRDAQAGHGVEEILSSLRAAGLSAIDSILVLKWAFAIDLNAAKALLHASSAWRDVAAASDALVEALLQAVTECPAANELPSTLGEKVSAKQTDEGSHDKEGDGTAVMHRPAPALKG